MATYNTTFWNLINSYKISIPIIQRDYAQGREEEFEKREKFLNVILKHLINNEELHLDFVYGRVKDNVFFPIDGQQRLTTLFLLHWYFVIKEKVSNEEKSKLSQFVYDTRISSREFCQSLIKEDIEIPLTTGDDTFIKAIKNKHWYRDKWDTDPTIKAMLVMIQDIHNKFYNIDSSMVFMKLVNDSLISFERLDLGAKGFELTDELYIKMNARGKQLTSFENFKANFIQLIDKYFKNAKLKHPIKGEISYSGYFSYKIEKEWTDLFWAFRDKETIVDSKFYSYFEFVAQMCYFKKYNEAKVDSFNNSFSQYEDIFQDEKNLLFLFNSLDKLYNLSLNNSTVEKQKIDIFFHTLNSQTTLFWNAADSANLFERIISNVKNEDPRNKILLYSVLSYFIKFDTTEFDDELQKVVRVIRNLLQATRQRNETKYNTNIRINNFGSYWILLEQLLSGSIYTSLCNYSVNNKGTQFSDVSLVNEIEKATILLESDSKIKDALIGLEEFEYFGGLIHLLIPKELYQNYPDFIQYFKEIFDDNIPSSLKLRALIACGFEGIYIKPCKMGEMWYFGENQNWTTVLTTDNAVVSASVIEFVNSYSQYIGTPEIRLQEIINNWLQNNPIDRTWKYYFIKYPVFTSKLNYFVSNKFFESRILGSEGSNPLVANHISPYALTVCNRINNKNICDDRDCQHQYTGNSPLILKNGIEMTSTNQGWLIPINQIINDSIISNYNLNIDNNNYVLKETDRQDRIEIAIDFINDILAL